MSGSLEAFELERLDDLERLRPEWSELWERTPGATPFQSPEWLLSWWSQLGHGQPWVIGLRRGNRLAGLAPFILDGDGPAPTVTLAGTGVTDYLDVLLEPDAVVPGAALVLGRLAGRRERWTVCDLQELREGSPLLATPPPPGTTAEASLQEVCPRALLPADVEALRRSLPARLRGELRSDRRRMERAGATWFELADRHTLPEYLEALFGLHRARWKERDLPGVLASEAVRAFHAEAAPALLARDLLRFHGLRFGGRLVAVLYCLARGETVYYYLGGFDPGLGRFSPGTLLVAHAMEDALRSGAREFDFLRGGESYKYRWGARDRWNRRLRLWCVEAEARARPGGPELATSGEHSPAHSSADRQGDG